MQDLLRVVLSIKAGKVSSAVLLRKLGNYSRKNRLYQAFRELGCVVRTVFLLQYISDPELREGITAVQNKVEAYNGFAQRYGKWLQRERRRVDAREQLRTAHEMFASMGAEAFADRASRELLATGETVRKRTVETSEELTAQEAQIARLARDGLSNPEIGTRLFISPRTVKYHLRKVFIKLGINSRNHLDRVLPSPPVGRT
jgi:DNA-binding CsgD family transcriptional regulator